MIGIVILLVLALIVHELGHLLAGLAFRVQISKCCLFFDPGFRLLDTGKRFGIRYCVGWIPFGAYVKFSPKEEGAKGVFLDNLHPLKRVVVSLAGIGMNLLLAYICIFSWVNHYADDEERMGLTEQIQLVHSIVQDEVKDCTSYISSLWKWEDDEQNTVEEDVEGFQMQTSLPESDVYNLIWRFALLNLFMAVFNLLPIPPLDGAQTLFHVYEFLFHRPVNVMIQLGTGLIGFLLIMASNAYDLYQMVWHFFE